MQPLVTNSPTFGISSRYYLASHASIGDDNTGNFHLSELNQQWARNILFTWFSSFFIFSFFFFFKLSLFFLLFLYFFFITAISNHLMLLCRNVLKVKRIKLSLSVFTIIP